VHGFIVAEFNDATAVGAAFDAFVGESEGRNEGDEEDEFGFHGVV
jgi:hypothetical protein